MKKYSCKQYILPQNNVRPLNRHLEARRMKFGSNNANKQQGRITPLYTKINTIMNSRKKKKVEVVSTLVKNILYGGKYIGYLPDVVYGIEHESDGKSAFYTDEAI